jgi:hypothetical protein
LEPNTSLEASEVLPAVFALLIVILNKLSFGQPERRPEAA